MVELHFDVLCYLIHRTVFAYGCCIYPCLEASTGSSLDDVWRVEADTQTDDESASDSLYFVLGSPVGRTDVWGWFSSSSVSMAGLI